MMRHFYPWFAATFVFLALAGTSPMLPLVWDEGVLIHRAASVKRWGWQVVDDLCGDDLHGDNHEPGTEQSPFSQKTIATSWCCTTVIEGHPGGYLAVIALGRTLADLVPQLPQKTAWRLGPILLMSLALGVMFSAIRRHFDTMAAILAVTAVLLVPRVFAHAHFATCDSVLMAAWLLAVATFPIGMRNAECRMQKQNTKCCTQYSALCTLHSALLWGLCFGLTLSAKFTGWAICVPFLLMIVGLQAPGFRLQGVGRRGQSSIAPVVRSLMPDWLPYVIGGCTALLVFYLLNPPLWHRPLAGFAEFLHLNTHRGEFNVGILFWGRMYDLNRPLPWYNTLVWVAITLPSLFFVMIPFGVYRMFSRGHSVNETMAGRHSPVSANRIRFSGLIVLHALVLLVVRAIPGTPPHDGVRLFVPAFPFLAIIAGIGMSQLWRMGSAAARRPAGSLIGRLPGRLLVVLTLAVGTGNLVVYAPQWLSFYNAVIGGVHGASRKGFEPTYYWDALDAEVIAVLNAGTGENEKICFTPAKSSHTLDLVRAWEGLQPPFRPDAPGQYRWYVFQHRPSGLTRADRILLRDFEPAYIKYVAQPSLFPDLLRRRHHLSQQTPVLYVFSYDDYLTAQRNKGVSPAQQ